MKERGLFPSSLKWCEAAGLSKGYLGNLKSRLARNPTGSANSADLTALARAGELDPTWLADGGETLPGRHDAHPSRAPVVALLRARNAPRGVIDGILSIEHKGGDPGYTFWLKEARKLIEADAEVQEMLGHLDEETEKVFG